MARGARSTTVHRWSGSRVLTRQTDEKLSSFYLFEGMGSFGQEWIVRFQWQKTLIQSVEFILQLHAPRLQSLSFG